nr:unnamed protein product [Callosobruchus analis]
MALHCKSPMSQTKMGSSRKGPIYQYLRRYPSKFKGPWNGTQLIQRKIMLEVVEEEGREK